MAESAQEQLTTKYTFEEPTQADHLPSKETIIDNLRAEETAGRGSVFDSTFLSALENPENTEKPLADVWQEVEDGFAEQNRVTSRPNPYLKEK